MRICTITVRAGSKGVSGKNWRTIAGLPLFAHSVRQAVECGLFDRIAVSTDAEPILETAAVYGATDVIRRPAELASDTAGKIPAIVHAVREVESQTGRKFSTMVDLDATSPLRIPADVAGAVHLLESTDAESVITGAEARRSPYFNLVEEDSAGHVALSKTTSPPVLRRQDAPRAYDMNASIYVWRRDALLVGERVFYPTTRLFEMPADRSHDIDSELDFTIVSWLMDQRED